jgi:aspartyl-tRNA(Asn)/glutamyl-tRNA(Gln) amidotransferase subunit A
MKYYYNAISTLENLGAVIIEIVVPVNEDPRELAHIIATSEVGYVHRELIQSSLHQYSEGAKKTFEKSKSISAHAYIDGLHKRVQKTKEISQLFESLDIIVTPTLPVAPTNVDQVELMVAGELVSVEESFIRYTCLFNITGHPALTIPCGLFNNTIPIGLQLIANHHREDLLIKAAYSFEQSSLLEFYSSRMELVKS